MNEQGENQQGENEQGEVETDASRAQPNGRDREQTFAPSSATQAGQVLPFTINRRQQEARGRRSQTKNSQRGGHYVRAVKPKHGPIKDISIDGTLRAAALRLATQGAAPLLSDTLVTAEDLRTKIRHSRTGNLILFVVDSSGSMGARKRMVAVKGAILSLLLDAYQKRDRVGLIVFRGQGAQLLVPPTNSVELAERQLRQIPTGGRTPLFAGLQMAHQLLTHYARQDAALAPLMVLVTDGRANSGPSPIEMAPAIVKNQIPTLLLDSEQGFVKMGQASQLAERLEALYMPLDQLNASAIGRSVRMLLR